MFINNSSSDLQLTIKKIPSPPPQKKKSTTPDLLRLLRKPCPSQLKIQVPFSSTIIKINCSVFLLGLHQRYLHESFRTCQKSHQNVSRSLDHCLFKMYTNKLQSRLCIIFMVIFFSAQILAFLLLIVSSDLDILSAIFKNIYLNNSFLSTAVVK